MTKSSGPYDPRPDLLEDAFFWRQALKLAYRDPEFYGLLHGLRCGGSRIEVRSNGSFKLNVKPLVDEWPEYTLETFQAKWLEPHRNMFIALFKDLAKVA